MDEISGWSTGNFGSTNVHSNQRNESISVQSACLPRSANVISSMFMQYSIGQIFYSPMIVTLTSSSNERINAPLRVCESHGTHMWFTHVAFDRYLHWSTVWCCGVDVYTGDNHWQHGKLEEWREQRCRYLISQPCRKLFEFCVQLKKTIRSKKVNFESRVSSG